ncbi:hypothetical protein HQ590_15745, partial [bacterium]|nr:hypothetical protein [bacterium]
VRVPVDDYAAIWMLAATDNETNLSDVVTFRLGVADGQQRVTYHDFVARVPRANAATPGPGVSQTIATPAGNLYLIRVPLGKAIAQDFKERRSLLLDFTKELRVAINLPDPNRFHLRPLGPPSGVRIYAVTLERSIFQMELTGAEPGNVFNEPQVPTFGMKLYNIRNDHWIPHSIKTVATCDDGTVVSQVLTDAFRSVSWSYGNPVVHQTVAVPVPKRGQYQLRLSIIRQGAEILYRDTTFAVLAPDTRQHRADAPWGTWDFAGTHTTPNDPDLRGPLYVKAGLRYGMSEQPESVRQQYGLRAGGDPRIHGTNDIGWIRQQAADQGAPLTTRLLIFHEAGISGPHLTRTPDLFTGRPPYQFNADEEKTWKALWAEADAAERTAVKEFPEAEVYFGNTTPHLLEEFLRRGWPGDRVHHIGNESGSFMRVPETQPTDFITGNSAMWMLRQIADHYGCSNAPMRQCLEIGYPGSGPGNLTEMTQAAYLIRHNLHSLAWRIPVIRPMTLTDMGNSYHFSNWGAAGLCHAWPNVCPKPAYVAYATLTQVLDGAAFSRAVPVESTSLYAFEFRKQDRSYVTCLWTLRGTRPVTLKVRGGRQLTVTDLMGRESAVAVNRREATVEVSNRPCYVSTDRPLSAITLGTPVHETKPAGQSFVVSALDQLADWTVESQPSLELEMYNFLNPRRQGNFEYREVPAPEAGAAALAVTPKLPVAGSKYLQMYSVLALNKPVELPGEPTQVAVLVNGNGGWGRLIFELEDASGQRWISIGTEQAGTPNQWMADWLKP